MLLFFCLELRLLFVNSFNLSLYYVLLTLLSFIESQRFTHKQNMSFLLTYGSLQNGWKGILSPQNLLVGMYPRLLERFASSTLDYLSNRFPIGENARNNPVRSQKLLN